jgi:hypothetical protein
LKVMRIVCVVVGPEVAAQAIDSVVFSRLRRRSFDL